MGTGGDINTIDSNALTGSQKSYSSPFQSDISNTQLSEIHGTYRSNHAYDNRDKSIPNGYVIKNVKQSLFGQEEYWRTNI